jgi:outer membrane murein-binding lipoprotein Lpp
MIAAKQLLIIGASMLATAFSGTAFSQETDGQYVQVAQIEIDPAQLENYRAAAREQIKAAIREEPGVLVLYSVSDVLQAPDLSTGPRQGIRAAASWSDSEG